jgi:hypothetical protein
MLIGLCGAAGAGKDSVANVLVDKFGFKRYAFADAVRDAALAIDPFVDTITWEHMNPEKSGKQPVRLASVVDRLGWDIAKREIPEVRRLLQVIGTEVGRQILGVDCWVNIVARKWYLDGYPDAVITDCRFQNEEEWIDLNGTIVRINRQNNPLSIGKSHASELYEVKATHIIENNGTLEDLEFKVYELYEELLPNV